VEGTSEHGNEKFGVLAAVVMNVAFFWDIAPCISYVNQRVGRIYHLHLQGRNQLKKKVEVIHSSETSVHIRTLLRCIPEDDNIHCNETFGSITFLGIIE
jgi:hypothetical protein